VKGFDRPRSIAWCSRNIVFHWKIPVRALVSFEDAAMRKGYCYATGGNDLKIVEFTQPWRAAPAARLNWIFFKVLNGVRNTPSSGITQIIVS
jgi:hypothetical protein